MRCEPTPTGAEVVALHPAPCAAEPSSLDHFLQPLAPLLADAEVTEICINRPGEVFVERGSGWRRESLVELSYDWCTALARLVANFTQQRISPSEPLLSATLPGGERIQIVLPVDHRVDRDAAELLERLQARDLVGFLRRAVQQRRNILLSGATGSGKTTIAKALILEIPPEDRIVTIEDVRELSLRNQPNHVRLFYSQGGQGLAAVSAGQLLASAKRQRPDRVFVSELRSGDEVYDYLVSINTGHPGSITSVHADSAVMAFVALAQLMKRCEAGRGMSTREGVELAQLSVDVVVQCRRLRQHRCVSEVWYDPGARCRGLG